jgi:hypothetical protein
MHSYIPEGEKMSKQGSKQAKAERLRASFILTLAEDVIAASRRHDTDGSQSNR